MTLALYRRYRPQRFSEVKGQRIRDGGQLCLSNEDLRREMTRVVLAGLRRSASPTHISIAQNDGGRPCECAECRAVDAEDAARRVGGNGDGEGDGNDDEAG